MSLRVSMSLRLYVSLAQPSVALLSENELGNSMEILAELTPDVVQD